MAQCEFLIREESKSCVACTGFYCMALGRKRKLSVVDDCRNNPLECTRYLEAHPELVEAVTQVGKAMDPDSEKLAAEVKPKKKARPKKAKPRKKVKAEVVVVPKVVLPPSTDCPYLGPTVPRKQLL